MSLGQTALAICYVIRYVTTLLALLPLIYNGMLSQHENESFKYNKVGISDQEDPLLVSNAI